LVGCAPPEQRPDRREVVEVRVHRRSDERNREEQGEAPRRPAHETAVEDEEAASEQRRGGGDESFPERQSMIEMLRSALILGTSSGWCDRLLKVG
jgi:hypothetical protein